MQGGLKALRIAGQLPRGVKPVSENVKHLGGIARIFLLQIFRSEVCAQKNYLTLCISTVSYLPSWLAFFVAIYYLCGFKFFLGSLLHSHHYRQYVSSLNNNLFIGLDVAQFLRVNFQQLSSPIIPRYVQQMFLFYALISTLLKILAISVGTF